MCYRTAGIVILLIPPLLILGGILLRAWFIGSSAKASLKDKTV
jgi:hypothetical protein